MGLFLALREIPIVPAARIAARGLLNGLRVLTKEYLIFFYEISGLVEDQGEASAIGNPVFCVEVGVTDPGGKVRRVLKSLT